MVPIKTTNDLNNPKVLTPVGLLCSLYPLDLGHLHYAISDCGLLEGADPFPLQPNVCLGWRIGHPSVDHCITDKGGFAVLSAHTLASSFERDMFRRCKTDTQSLQVHATCADTYQNFWNSFEIVSIVIDVVLFTWPLPTISGLAMPFSRKLMVSACFASRLVFVEPLCYFELDFLTDSSSLVLSVLSPFYLLFNNVSEAVLTQLLPFGLP